MPYTITGGVGLVSQEEKLGRTIAGKSISNYYRLRRGDFAFNKSSTKAHPEGYIARLHDDVDAAVPSSIFTCFRCVSEEADGEYLDWLFQSNLHGHWLRKFITVGARAHGALNVNDDDLYALPVPLPPGKTSRAEQRKIAECLASLDDWIAAETDALAALRRHKIGLMQQLFPRPGETRPRRRFPEFQDAKEWEPIPIDKLADVTSGGTPSKSNPAYWGGTIPWVSAKDMKTLRLTDSADHVTQVAVDDGAKLMPAGTLLMLTRGMTLMKDVPICLLQRPMTFNQDVKALSPKPGVIGEFLAFLLNASKPSLLSLVDIAGHGTGRLNTDEVKQLELAKPEPSEQRRIAGCLIALDDCIPARADSLAALYRHKQGLMHQLFPQLDNRAGGVP
ncbi:MAG: restriction endonuclease subunit S [Planctomycetota bacterium]